jgi:hypothetical protein
MTTSFGSEDIIAECKRRIDECDALLERTSVQEYRQAISAMARAWMKIAQSEQRTRQNGERRSTPDRLQVSSNPKPAV